MYRCKVCSTMTVTKLYKGEHYCKKCYPKEWNVSYYIPAKKEMIEVNCAVCGKLFTKVKNTNKKYCSNECSTYSLRTEYQRGKFLILERDNFTCFYCGRVSYKDQAELHVDHVISRSMGGISTADNLVTACRECNLQKSNLQIENIDEILKEIKTRNEHKNIPDKLKIKLSGSLDV